jgi:transcriptional regulator with XRE-family HTH domain
MAKKVPNPVDKHVGSRVRMRRMMLGMSQEKLGDALSITFQQVQKYEKGTNRISASRLQHISHILQVSVPFFFEGAPHQPGQPRGPAKHPHRHMYPTSSPRARGLRSPRPSCASRTPSSGDASSTSSKRSQATNSSIARP